MLFSGGMVRPQSNKYEGWADQCTNLMISYQAGEVNRRDCLIIIGAMSWKQSLRVVGPRVAQEAESQGGSCQADSALWER